MVAPEEPGEPRHAQKRENEKQRLEEALALNKPLATAYYMKEDLRSSTTGYGGRKPLVYGCSRRWPRQWRRTARASWRTTTR